MPSTQKEKDIVIMQNGKVMDIPVEGTLGLLALGAVGIKAWRQKAGKPAWLLPQKETDTTEGEKENE